MNHPQKEITIGIISDGKYGERAFKNISEKFRCEWILVPEIEPTVMLDDEIDIEIPNCDIYISYVRHPDIIMQLVELDKPIILGVLPGVGLLKQARNINSKVIHAPTMCSLEDCTGIPEVDLFIKDFGKPRFDLELDSAGTVKGIKVRRSSLCGSSNAGASFLKDKGFSKDTLQDFALHVCHECRAPRFGHSCDKEVAGFIHLNSLFESVDFEMHPEIYNSLKDFIFDVKNEYENRSKKSREILKMVK